MKTAEEILNEIIREEIPKMLLETEVETKRHNGLEYRMINEILVVRAMEEYANQSKLIAVEPVKNETAVDWLYSKLKSRFKYDGDLLETFTFAIAIAKQKEREQQANKSKWVNVKDKLPENYKSILVYGRHIRSVSLFSNGIFYPDFTVLKHEEITHWQPLPNNP